MAGSGSFDRGPINGQGGEATWQPVERSIARGYKAVDLHLSEGGTWRDRINRIPLKSQPLIKRSYNG